MISALLIAAAETAPATLSLQSVLLGLFSVAIVYSLVSIAGLRRRLAEISATARAAPVAASAPAPSPKAAPVREELPPELVAVIAVAVRVALGGSRHRILSLSAADQKQADQRSAWSAEGRRDVFLSHRLR